MTGNLAVEGSEELQNHEKYIEYHGVSHDPPQCTDLLPARVEFRHLSYDETQYDKQGRAGAKGRREKAGRHNSGQPVMSSGNTRVQERGHGVDAEGPWDGYVDQDLNPIPILYPLPLCAQDIPADNDIQQHVYIKDKKIPEQDRSRVWVNHEIQHPGKLAEVHHDEQAAHNNCADREEFPQNGYPPESLIVMDIIGKYHHDPAGRNTHEIRELADIEAPGDVPAHPCYLQAFRPLVKIEAEAQPNEGQKEYYPAPVFLTSLYCLVKHVHLILYNKY